MNYCNSLTIDITAFNFSANKFIFYSLTCIVF